MLYISTVPGSIPVTLSIAGQAKKKSRRNVLEKGKPAGCPVDVPYMSRICPVSYKIRGILEACTGQPRADPWLSIDPKKLI
jgi:hypothetical protein